MKKWKPCDCLKGGVDGNENVCSKCNGIEWVPDRVEKKWTFDDLNKSLKENVKGYGDAIAVAALYKKLYGEFPHIGLSGAQAEMADSLVNKLPNPK